jgi:hypothetical protein
MEDSMISLVMAFKGNGWGAGMLGALNVSFGSILYYASLVTVLALSGSWRSLPSLAGSSGTSRRSGRERRDSTSSVFRSWA